MLVAADVTLLLRATELVVGLKLKLVGVKLDVGGGPVTVMRAIQDESVTVVVCEDTSANGGLAAAGMLRVTVMEVVDVEVCAVTVTTSVMMTSPVGTPGVDRWTREVWVIVSVEVSLESAAAVCADGMVVDTSEAFFDATRPMPTAKAHTRLITRTILVMRLGLALRRWLLSRFGFGMSSQP